MGSGSQHSLWVCVVGQIWRRAWQKPPHSPEKLVAADEDTPECGTLDVITQRGARQIVLVPAAGLRLGCWILSQRVDKTGRLVRWEEDAVGFLRKFRQVHKLLKGQAHVSFLKF